MERERGREGEKEKLTSLLSTSRFETSFRMKSLFFLLSME